MAKPPIDGGIVVEANPMLGISTNIIPVGQLTVRYNIRFT